MADYFRPTRLRIDPFGTPDTGFATMRVTSPYGTRDDPLNPGGTVFHGGLDIGNARLGDDITAIYRGIVIYSSRQPQKPWSYPAPPDKLSTWGPSYGGLTTVIRHPDGRWSQYAHQGSRTVAVGDEVATGQIIGKVGESGSAFGHGHLHFGIRDPKQLGNGHDGFVDPWPLIDPTAKWEDPAVIAELKAQLRQCQDRNKALILRRDSLKAQIETLEAEIAELEPLAAQVPDLQTKVKRLRLTVKRLRDKLEAEETDV